MTTPTAQSGPSTLELRAEESMRGISEMIRLRMTRSPAISQMEEWIETINVLLAAALKTPPAGARDAVTDEMVDAAMLAHAKRGVIDHADGVYDAAAQMHAALEAALTGKADGGPWVHGHRTMDDFTVEATQPAATGAGEDRVSLTHDELQAIKDAAYRDGYERRHLEVLGALA